MFREFVYLDMDRVQSIVAQLNEGLLTDIANGTQSIQASGTVGKRPKYSSHQRKAEDEGVGAT